MLVIKGKKGLFSTATVWFAEEKYKEADIVYYRSCSSPVTQFCLGTITLNTDLRNSDDELLKICESNCRNEIRRAKREGVVTEYYYGEKISKKLLTEYAQFYKEFHEGKGLGKIDIDSLVHNLELYARENGLLISRAILFDTPSVYHIYKVHGENARLYHSCSLFREADNKDIRKKIGMANRMLHYDDLIWMKNKGYLKCDWGGAGRSSEVENIYRFKKSFGGDETIVYSGTDYHNPFLKWLYWLYIVFSS